MKDNSIIHRIVLCRLGGIGDVIHTLPLAEFLKRKYPNSNIEYITSGDTADLLSSHCLYIDRVWICDKENKKQLAGKILSEKGKIDYFFNLHSSPTFFFFNLFYIRAKKYFQYKKDNNVHAVVNFARTYDAAISAVELKSNTLSVNNAGSVLDKYGLKDVRYVCFVPGVGKVRTHRGWPFEKWLSLTKKLLHHDKDIKVVFLGGKDEEKIIENWLKLVREVFAENIEQDFKSCTVNLIGKLTLSQGAEVISKSKYLISCDTGLLHLACALSKKVIGLYGPTLPERSGPFTGNFEVIRASDCECIGRFRDIKHCKKSNLPIGSCMNNLNIESVFNIIERSSVQFAELQNT